MGRSVDPAALERIQVLCRRSDEVTYEFENVHRSDLQCSFSQQYNFIKQGFRPLFDSASLQDVMRAILPATAPPPTCMPKRPSRAGF